jgi:uncharacterized FAD-dependent dehydrogenase
LYSNLPGYFKEDKKKLSLLNFRVSHLRVERKLLSTNMQQLKLSLAPLLANDEEKLRKIILDALGEQAKDFNGYRIIQRSIDARSRRIRIDLVLEIFLGEEIPSSQIPYFHFHHTSASESVMIVGAGPAGLFCALQLLEAGIKPVIIERGKTVRERRRDIAALNKEHIVNPDSNYCFGEGGAGTYSDGKLYTRSTKRGDVHKILQLLVHHGADEKILTDAHPHIGTNKLPQIIENIRYNILEHGGEFHFDIMLKDIVVKENQVECIITESVLDGNEKQFTAQNLILATGHSARDIFELLRQKNILIEAKPFAMGIRVEHPQELIDRIQYHCANKAEVIEKRKFLPAASYSLVHQVRGRGVYSFCMCPGGIIAPCATAPGEIVVNGWSPSKRNNPFANSGIVVGIELEDLKQFISQGTFAGLHYQRTFEHMAFEAGGRTQTAPAQRLVDFVQGKFSSTLPDTSYQPGIKSAPLHELLPKEIASRLQAAFVVFGKKMEGYLTNAAVIHGVESRTSSPVRIPRDRDTLEHPHVKGLFPVGEGAGYAGGIVSAAIDGQNAAKKIAQKIGAIR